MSGKIILQPAGDGDAAEHYVDTISNPVSLNRIKPFIESKLFDRLQDLYPSNVVPVWGVVPGGKMINLKKWQRIDSGDVVLFAKKKQIFSSAVVTFKEHNKNLALELWKQNRSGETWEYLYFLDQVKDQSIPYSIFNQAAGYEPNFVIQGFNVLDETKSLSIFSAFDLESSLYFPEVTKEQFNNAITVLADHLGGDVIVMTAARTEQSYLRKHLFKNKRISPCGICSRDMPVEMLITAHIKPRSQCSLDERRDVSHVVMPMCRLGCDDLFERGFIAVENGKVITSKLPWLPQSIKDYFKLIDGKPAKHWSKDAEKYFLWHLKRVYS